MTPCHLCRRRAIQCRMGVSEWAAMAFAFAIAATGSCGRLTVHGEDNGGADADSDTQAGGEAGLTVPAVVVINEIMYAPVAEDADEENHEFVEIFNRGPDPISLEGWAFESSGGVKFTFPRDATFMPGQYRVVAKNRAMLARVEAYGLAEADLLGDYVGQLDNGGDTLVLRDPSGNVVDRVSYDDHFPWPASADALGVGEEWLAPEEQPLTKHRYRGRSLERVSADFPSDTPANWEASVLDGATPGKANSAAGAVAPIVEAYAVAPVGGEGPLIRKDQGVTISARFSSFAGVTGVEVESFVDDVGKSKFVTSKAAMTLGANGAYTTVLDAQKDSSVVRFRIRATRGGKTGVAAPRRTDPYPRALAGDPDGWFSYFVSPRITIQAGPNAGKESAARAIHLFVRPADWTLLEAWLAKERALDFDRSRLEFTRGGCELNPDWNSSVPATLVYDGQVHDVRVRYEGGWWNRGIGFPITRWAYPGPTLPAGKKNLLALSWDIKLPRYSRPKDLKTLRLKKQFQGCPGTVTHVENKLIEKASAALEGAGGQPIPAFRNSYARLYINRGYYHYVEQQETVDDLLWKRVYGDGPVGDHYKNDGTGGSGNLGPVGYGNFDFYDRMKPNPFCPQKYTVPERYAATYVRKTHDYRPYDEVIKLVNDLSDARDKDAARRAQGQAGYRYVKEYLDKYWEVDTLLSQYAVRNWSGTWDDTFHNVDLYKNPRSGKWTVITTDVEWDFGIGNIGYPGTLDHTDATVIDAPAWNPRGTFYKGWKTGADPCVWNACELMTDPQMCAMSLPQICNAPGYNALKDAVLGAYRTELDDRMRELVKNDILTAKDVLAVIDEGIAAFSMDDWLDAPIDRRYCDVPKRHEAMKAWARARHETVVSRLCGSSPAACGIAPG